MAIGVPVGRADGTEWHPQRVAGRLTNNASASFHNPLLRISPSENQRINILLVKDDRRSKHDFAASHRKPA